MGSSASINSSVDYNLSNVVNITDAKIKMLRTSDVVTTYNYVNKLIKNRVNVKVSKQLKIEQLILNMEKIMPDEIFIDTIYKKSWLKGEFVDNLFQFLANLGEKSKPNDLKGASKTRSKYPLWTKYYGVQRSVDGARALDRWGSYHESWTRVEEPPDMIKQCCEKLRQDLNLPEYSCNSIVVNYYFDGENNYIPAHRDSVACMEDGSQVICLSLGAERDFVFCHNDDVGKYEKSKMNVCKEWRVKHGDLICLGTATNDHYCHSVTKELTAMNMRISVIFRTITKSFIDSSSASVKTVHYANRTQKDFQAVCITTKDIHDVGHRVHIADLIQEREDEKKRSHAKVVSPIVEVMDHDDEAVHRNSDVSITTDSTYIIEDHLNISSPMGSPLPEYSQSDFENEQQSQNIDGMDDAIKLRSYYLGEGVAIMK